MRLWKAAGEAAAQAMRTALAGTQPRQAAPARLGARPCPRTDEEEDVGVAQRAQQGHLLPEAALPARVHRQKQLDGHRRALRGAVQV